MSKHASISEMDNDLMNRSPILVCMSHDMAKIQSLYDQFRDVLLEQDNAKIIKARYFYFIVRIMRCSLNRLRFLISMPIPNEIMITMRYMTASATIQSVYQGLIEFIYEEAKESENASENVAEASGSRTASNVDAEMFRCKEMKRRQIIHYIRREIIPANGEVVMSHIFKKMLEWHDDYVARNFLCGHRRQIKRSVVRRLDFSDGPKEGKA